MPTSLDRLSFDVLYHIASSLDFDDIVHLGYTCRQLKILLDEVTLCRRAIKTHFPHTNEAKSALEKKISYSEALKAIYNRRHAFSNAYPFSARIAGQGNSFLYRQGVLCVLHGHTIRVTDVHATSQTKEFDLSNLLNVLSLNPNSPSSPSGSQLKISLMHYSDGLVTVHVEPKGKFNHGHLLVIPIASDPQDGESLIKTIPLESSSKLFVRHSAHYLYYGTYTGMGDHGHHEWELRGVSLDERYDLPKRERPLQLEDFFGTDIGSTIAFEIHEGYFYAVSNQTSFEVEELDWTSFYHCVRFPLKQPVREKIERNPRVYRRQHAEGPIHDSWTDLSLQVDEKTNHIRIVEARREWQKASSRQQRTFYIADMELSTGSPSTTDSEAGSPGIGPSTGPLLPSDDLFTDLLDSSNNPNYAPVQPRYNRNVHPEIPPNCPAPRSFLLARTKFRAYNYSCNAFLDLVEDERCCNNPSGLPCLRLRIGSRRIAPMDNDMDDKTASAEEEEGGQPDMEDDQYRHSPIRMWPHPASTCPCSKRIHDIVNPPLPSGQAHSRSVTGALDNRSLVYMVKPGKSYDTNEENEVGTIVVVDFSGASLQKKQMCHSPAGDGEDSVIADALNPSVWEWRPGLEKLCRRQQCQ